MSSTLINITNLLYEDNAAKEWWLLGPGVEARTVKVVETRAVMVTVGIQLSSLSHMERGTIHKKESRVVGAVEVEEVVDSSDLPLINHLTEISATVMICESYSTCCSCR